MSITLCSSSVEIFPRRLPQALLQNNQSCLTLLGVSGFVADLGLAGTQLGLVEVTFTGPRLVGTEIKKREFLMEVKSAKSYYPLLLYLMCNFLSEINANVHFIITGRQKKEW